MPQPIARPSASSAFWRKLALPLARRGGTPFYLFSAAPVAAALAELDQAFARLPVRHWLSCKTQPLPALLTWWLRQGRPIEVVSEFEFLAALETGFPVERILINGPAKHCWLPRHAQPGLWVNFDSIAELRALAPLAARHHWHCGLRLNPMGEFDPENPACPTQFGLAATECAEAVRLLRRRQLGVETVHFHLRTNVAEPRIYQRAMEEVSVCCRGLSLAPRFLDLGGGFPPPHVRRRGGPPIAAGFSLKAMAQVYRRAMREFPSVEELWLENGRWLTARSGVLAIRILDVKERRGMRLLICDGGRTMNALVAIWEDHDLIPLRPRKPSASTPTTVTGPTCMAFDQLTRAPLPRSWRTGDVLLWLDAGGYHLPWETRFSHGLAAVYWHEENQTQLVRPRESFGDWWAPWKHAARC